MYWERDSILNNISEYTSPNDIFQEVCDAIGRYYEKLDFKYSRSRPKISAVKRNIKVEINFWSSRSNMYGKFVNLEILPYFYSLEVKKVKVKQGIKNNGLLFGHVELLTEIYPDAKPGMIKTRQIFEEDKDRFEDWQDEAFIRKNVNCNVYKIDNTKYKKIIDFIDEQIEIVNVLHDYTKLQAFIESKPRSIKEQLTGNSGDTFREFISLNYGDKADTLFAILK